MSVCICILSTYLYAYEYAPQCVCVVSTEAVQCPQYHCTIIVVISKQTCIVCVPTSLLSIPLRSDFFDYRHFISFGIESENYFFCEHNFALMQLNGRESQAKPLSVIYVREPSSSCGSRVIRIKDRVMGITSDQSHRVMQMAGWVT